MKRETDGLKSIFNNIISFNTKFLTWPSHTSLRDLGLHHDTRTMRKRGCLYGVGSGSLPVPFGLGQTPAGAPQYHSLAFTKSPGHLGLLIHFLPCSWLNWQVQECKDMTLWLMFYHQGFPRPQHLVQQLLKKQHDEWVNEETSRKTNVQEIFWRRINISLWMTNFHSANICTVRIMPSSAELGTATAPDLTLLPQFYTAWSNSASLPSTTQPPLNVSFYLYFPWVCFRCHSHLLVNGEVFAVLEEIFCFFIHLMWKYEI